MVSSDHMELVLEPWPDDRYGYDGLDFLYVHIPARGFELWIVRLVAYNVYTIPLRGFCADCSTTTCIDPDAFVRWVPTMAREDINWWSGLNRPDCGWRSTRNDSPFGMGCPRANMHGGYYYYLSGRCCVVYQNGGCDAGDKLFYHRPPFAYQLPPNQTMSEDGLAPFCCLPEFDWWCDCREKVYTRDWWSSAIRDWSRGEVKGDGIWTGECLTEQGAGDGGDGDPGEETRTEETMIDVHERPSHSNARLPLAS